MSDSARQMWDERYAASDAVWTRTPNVLVEQVTSGLPPGTALDLAAGEGRNALWLAENGWDATAVDFSQVALDRAEAWAAQGGDGPGRLTTVVADLLQYRPVSTFDLVLVVYLQLPAEQRRHVLRQAAAPAVGHGGLLLVVAHDSTNLTDGVGGPQDPQVLYTAQDVADDVAGLALAPVRLERVPRPVTMPDGAQREALDALALFRRA